MDIGRLAEAVSELEAKLALQERRLFDLERTNERIVPIVNELATEGELARRVGEELRRREARGWTRKERAIAIVAVIATIGTFGSRLVELALGL